MKLYFIRIHHSNGCTNLLFAPVQEDEINSLFCTTVKEDAEGHAEIMHETFPGIKYTIVEGEVTFNV